MTSPIITWLNGFSAFAIVCSAWIFVLISLYYYRKYKGKIFLNGILLGLAIAFGWTGITLSFLSVVFYSKNVPGLRSIISYFSYSTIPFGMLAIIIVSWDVAGAPYLKKIVLIGFIAFSIAYYIILIITFPEAIVCPEVPDGEIYDDWINPQAIFYYFVWIGIITTAIITGIGFNKFRKLTAGNVKKKSLFLIIATPVIGISILLDTVIFMEPHVNFLFIPRFLIILGVYLIHLGFRPDKNI
ncbi:MAG: hypothetical protein ACFFAH_13575 [Promethearchaeota archaeon]